jgi:sterol desaturase/sphingolipid hydroxylase (fatty acid hydroxylase superfamily)
MYESFLITVGLTSLWAAIEHAYDLYRRPGVLTMRELGASLVSFGVSRLTGGMAGVLVLFSVGALWPRSMGALAGWSSWPFAVLFVLIADYGFYWVHRKSHEYSWLWRLHKPHHVPQQLHASIAFRENWIFNLLLPHTWAVPLFVWLGQAEGYLVGSAFFTLIGLGLHCELRWDLVLQRNRFLRPILWVVERVITLPDVHHVRHGVGRYGDAMKNYGASLSIFDLIHGTLVIPHARQEAFGLPEGVPVEPWAEQLFWPFVRSTKKVADRRRPRDEASPAAALAAAEALIHTADGRAVVVR